MEVDFKSVKLDPCVYTYPAGGAIDILTTYVEDILLVGKQPGGAEADQAEADESFSRTDIGDVSLVLAMGVTRDHEKGTVAITQDRYIYNVPGGAARRGKPQSNVYA